MEPIDRVSGTPGDDEIIRITDEMHAKADLHRGGACLSSQAAIARALEITGIMRLTDSSTGGHSERM